MPIELQQLILHVFEAFFPKSELQRPVEREVLLFVGLLAGRALRVGVIRPQLAPEAGAGVWEELWGEREVGRVLAEAVVGVVDLTLLENQVRERILVKHRLLQALFLFLFHV